jgi:hypothetical protein
MNPMSAFFMALFGLDAKKDNTKKIVLAFIVLVFALAFCALVNAHPEWARLMYCQSSAAHSIECTAKGWW